MPNSSPRLRQITQVGWVVSQAEHDQLRVILEAWLVREFPHRLTLESHDRLTPEVISRWVEDTATEGAFAGLLDGDSGPLTVAFQSRQDAIHFKLSWL